MSINNIGNDQTESYAMHKITLVPEIKVFSLTLETDTFGSVQPARILGESDLNSFDSL